MVINKPYIQKHLSHFLAIIIIGLICLTSIRPQHIAVDFAWIASGYDLLYETSLGNGSLLSKSILFIGDIKPGLINVIYSIVMSFISVLGLFFFARAYRLELLNISILLGFIFFLDFSFMYGSGLNYPLSILMVRSNTPGQIGFAFSILTIATFLINYKSGAALLILNLLIHPTLGLLTASYICLQTLLRKNYVGFILPISISLVFILFNLQHLPLDISYAIDYIYTINVHQKVIDLIDLKFLIIPIVFTIFISGKKDLLAEWIFIITCLIVSYLYYNLKIEFLQFEFLALMPSRGVNLGVGIIIIKYCIDIIKNPNQKKFIVLLVMSVLFTQYPILSKPGLLIISGLMILITYCFVDVFIEIRDKPGQLWKVKKNHFLFLLTTVIFFINLKISTNTLIPREYDQFINSKNGYVLDFTNDYNIMVRNRNIIELLPMPLMDGFSYNPNGLDKANTIFMKIFSRNLWDLEIENKCGCIRYRDIKHLIENFSQANIDNAKTLGLQYIIAPASSKIPLNIIWNNEKYIIYEVI